WRLVGPWNRDGLASVIHDEDVVEGECPLEGTPRDAKVLDLRREGKVHLFYPGVLLDPEGLQLPGEDTQLRLLPHEEDLCGKNQGVEAPLLRIKDVFEPESPLPPRTRKYRGKRQPFVTSKNKCKRRDATQVVQEDRGGLGGDACREYEYQRDHPREFHELRVRQDTPPRRAEPYRRPKRGRQVLHPPRDLRRSRPGLHREVEETKRPHQAREGDRTGLPRLRQSSHRWQEAHSILEVGDVHAEEVHEKGWH